MPPLLQPAAHALLQARDDVALHLQGFPAEKLWQQPAGRASVGFHLRHMAGVMSRMRTYAAGTALSESQFDFLRKEAEASDISVAELFRLFSEEIERSLDTLRRTEPASLTEPRPVGRRQLPATVIGLLFHMAEHVQRHTGQLLVTAAVASRQPGP